jgi:methyl-accepting chemotaxis protein/methyl-accepting chemotaxis protein-3 (ribose and galactose sensor receptor)
VLYTIRWQVELFFKRNKLHLRIKRSYGTSKSPVKSQIWIAVSVDVLVAMVKKRLDLNGESNGERLMKLSIKLGLVVGCAALGTLLLVLLALQNIRSSMLEDRRAQITMMVSYAEKLVSGFVSMEKSGVLSKEEAQTRAKQALSTLRGGDDYVLVRTFDGEALVHADPRRIGQVDKKMVQSYLVALQAKDLALAEIKAKRPGGDIELPKINGVAKIPEWNWVIGFGQYVDDIDKTYQKTAVRFGLLGALIFVAVLAAAFFMSRNIYSTLGGEPEHAASVARAIADGDLTQRMDKVGQPGSLMQSIQQMQQQLQAIIQSIQQNADKVGDASASLSDQMEQITESAKLAADAVSTSASAIEELAVSVDHISQSSRETEISASHATKLAEQGGQLVQRASDEIQRVAGQVDQASGRIAGLVDRSHEIGGIARVIKEIADQTNLLALNAAIEAARAGEQGRGFAVVADEVRKLAERTGQATDQITAMIRAIDDDTTSVVKGMEAVGPQVAIGVDIAKQAGEALREINDATSIALSNVSDVTSATSEQSQASGSVARSVEQISSMLDESAQSVQAANENVLVLEQLARDLRQSVARFKVD